MYESKNLVVNEAIKISKRSCKFFAIGCVCKVNPIKECYKITISVFSWKKENIVLKVAEMNLINVKYQNNTKVFICILQ